MGLENWDRDRWKLTLIVGELARESAGRADAGARRNARCALARSEVLSECAVYEQNRSKARKKKEIHNASSGKMEARDGKKAGWQGMAGAPQ